ncbi:class I SAM-dependent methyltransferase [Pantoea agglomerans]|uniref:class I SAM-dependent methyltransferase n=1 Tax=Enterobacter agglomerans TaxID=549 RepID=UPI000E21830B|nr:class I SAM-dependent methyltransferase [Pantoea agglomerans]MCH9407619.1 class I SAM-dependent methyltransferase [Pantoea agglomerans]QTC48601.1 class I SAM-dependent methyltransferase [Pantoea agglomerans]WEC75249.1 class I SAM-dependent methyltransferase [Pantoea agglomerans]WNK33258.1 class I SAM-dependent methyltransferase [Pantoea agglomerans]WNK38042.1 class I SAM-dependent methyltransferase [Pantoea agglomerans]
MKNEKFDGLASNYDKYRPRYPEMLFEEIHNWMLTSANNIYDIGAGTGIAIEGMTRTIGKSYNFTAIDISEDMISKGREKLPRVTWVKGKAEEILHDKKHIDVIMAAQSFQWMDRAKTLETSLKSLNDGGIFAILQNNRDYRNNEFLDKYESVLEKFSPGYSRNYRDYDYEKEITNVFRLPFADFKKIVTGWTMEMASEDFFGFISSSTQVQRAINNDRDNFLKEIDLLLAQHSIGGKVNIDYISELFMARKRSGDL